MNIRRNESLLERVNLQKL